MRNLILILSLLLAILLSGCSEDSNLNNEVDDSQLEISKLKNELESKYDEINLLNSKIEELEQVIRRNEFEKEESVKKISNDNEVNNKKFNAFNESLSVIYEKINYNNFKEAKIRELLGEPVERLEYEDPHSGQSTIDLIYEEATFTYNIYNGEEKLKWYSLLDDMFCTNKGISIGSHRDEVLELYDEEYYGFYSKDEFINIGEKQGIRFELDNDYVTKIKVWFTYE